jgi:hypothetical protein
MAHVKYTHGGQSVSRVGVYHSSVRTLMTTKLKPVRVIYLAVSKLVDSGLVVTNKIRPGEASVKIRNCPL